MEIPRFEKQNVNPRFVTTDIGDAFQQFVQELLLPEHPALHRLPGGGKDGGIDLIDTSGTCLVVECKVVGEDDYAEVERRWKTVRNHLDEHLLDPSGPTKGQSQYGPWYSTDPPITEYVFCVSASLANEQQRRDLQKAITDFFHKLAQQRPHLSHLSRLEVSILDWNKLSTRLRQRPHLLFRWFPSTRPNGLVPLDEAPDVGTFRAYLTAAKLPYYSLAEHLRMRPAPKGVGILDEESLLTGFENPEITGLVISGKGGIGKTRLTLELGWLVLRNGWSVMRVQSRLKQGALEDLAERLNPESPALLLVDYIETQSDFGELVENLNVLNDSGVARLRYIAVCRTGYYHQAIATTGRHLLVDLTPPPGAAALEWFSDYRRQTVARILAKAGLPMSRQHLAVCHDLPILAVFLAYLHTSGRSEDLAELLTEIEFGRWVRKRVQLSFPSRDVSRELALLVPLFPMADPPATQLSHHLYRALFDRLATDGWVEKVPANAPESSDTWVTAHDVLADQILLSYLQSIPNTTELFVAELFSLAAETGCLASAIVSLQRIADTPPLSSITWVKIIEEAIAANEFAWSGVRDLLIRTSILSVPEQISLLHNHDELWAGAEQSITFQDRLGWLARWIVKNDDRSITEQHKGTLILWISKAVPFAEVSNFVITWGLRLAPETIQEAALHWIKTRPLVFQTHYVMVAWLELGLRPEPIAIFVQRWCQRFWQSSQLSYLAPAWLKAKGDKALVQDSIQKWLIFHKTDAAAQFVFKAWLDVGGDKAPVQDSIKEWLVSQKTDADAEGDFVFNAWLDAGGDKALVQDSIKEWLVSHKTDAGAQFVFKAWLRAGGDKALVQDSIKEWLVSHKTDAEAQFVFNAWLRAGGDKALVQDAIKEWLISHKSDAEADFVFHAWLYAGGDKALVQDSIKEWLISHKTDAEAQFVFSAWLHAGGDKALIQTSMKEWLVGHKTDAEASRVFHGWLHARGDKALVQDSIKEWLVSHKTDAEAQFVFNAWLDAGGDKALVQHSIKEWLVAHRTVSTADFIYKAWLDARGDKALVQDSIKEWLVSHKTDAEASHVYKSWLDAGGDKALVQDAIKEWLAVHKTVPEARFVYEAWLEAGGERSAVWDAFLIWMDQYRNDESGVYMTKFIAKQPDLSAKDIKQMLSWCRTSPGHDQVLWRLTQLGNKLLVPGVAEDVVSTSEAVFENILRPTTHLDAVTRGQITTLLSYLIGARGLSLGPLRERVDSLLVKWLRHPLSFGNDPKPHHNIQRVSYLQRLSELIATGTLDVGNDRESLKRFMKWVDAWEIKWKERAAPLLDELKNKYPASELWEIVRFGE